MKTCFLLLLLHLLAIQGAIGQSTSQRCSNPLAESVMQGQYDPAVFYSNQTGVTHPDSIAENLINNISPDSLKQYIIQLASFRNRNSGSDTISGSKGIGAARNWIFHKFERWSSSQNNRLIPSFFRFEQTICNIGRHKNVLAVLPGTDTSDNSIILIEGHMDSRCEDLCDTACLAQGVEDNASGTALTMELARVMSNMKFSRTIVFMITTAEEQGLFGAEAFADYSDNKGIKIRAVLNNDVIGGIICGATSSPPGCSGINSIDSTQVRLFSFGGFNSKHKQFARFVKLQYKENLDARMPVKMLVSVMSPEDRTGRGGDHIPFRQHAFTAIRFTSANEHGNANVSNTNYSDRQHSTRDTLGTDTDGNLQIDSFFVNFNYLARNTIINGMAAAVAASGPTAPDISASLTDDQKIAVSLTGTAPYRVAVRSLKNDWDSVYTLSASTDTILVPPAIRYYVSAASVNNLGMESLFSKEISLIPTLLEKPRLAHDLELLPNHPNPFDEATIISVFAGSRRSWRKASLRISDSKGNKLQEIPLEIHEGLNEILYEHGYQNQGVILCSLIIDGKVFSSRKMVFSN